MTRLRLFSTLFVLALGVGMASHYLTPDTHNAPERTNAQSQLPADKTVAPEQALTTVITTPESPIGPASMMEPVPTPTVALPTGPLLRSATDAPPIDTSSLDPIAPVRHDPDISPGLTAEPLSVQPGTLDPPGVQPAPLARPAATRRPKSRSGRSHKSKTVEQLFINPLGVR